LRLAFAGLSRFANSGRNLRRLIAQICVGRLPVLIAHEQRCYQYLA